MDIFKAFFLGVLYTVSSLILVMAIVILFGSLAAWIAMLAWGSLLHMTGWDVEYGLPFIGFWQMYMITIILGIIGSFFKGSTNMK